MQASALQAKQGNYLPIAEANEVIDGRIARRRATKLFYGVGLILVLAAVAHAAFEAVADAPVFRIQKIRIEGLTGSLRDEVRSTAQSYLAYDSSLLNFDSDRLRELIEKNPLVGDLRFEKHFPDTLVIGAVRREPAALVCAGGFYLVDREGRVLQELDPEDLPKYDFPFFTGLPTENLHRGEKIYSATFHRALELCRLLRERNPELYELVSELNLGGGDSSGSIHEHSLTAHLRGGAEVRLGNRNAAEILPTLDLFLQILKEQKGDLAELAYVDLRYRDRIFYMDRTTYLASCAGVLEEAERLAAAEAARLQKNAARTKRLEQTSKRADSSRSSSSPAQNSSRPRIAASGLRR